MGRGAGLSYSSGVHGRGLEEGHLIDRHVGFECQSRAQFRAFCLEKLEAYPALYPASWGNLVSSLRPSE